jgi:hypothetical protein
MLPALVGLSEAGRHLGGHPGQDPIHHLAYIAVLSGAVLTFVVYALRDVRRHGRPSFSWAVRPSRPE